MTATAHALMGGAIAASVNNPTLGITLSAMSHPILDMIPHWDFGWGWRKKSKPLLFAQATLDLALGIVLAYLIFGQFIHNYWYFLVCVFVSEVWDMMEAPYWFLNWKFPPFSTIYNIQSRIQGKAKNFTIGVLTQVATIMVAVFLLQFVPKF